jgi:sugar phosphate permease
MVALQTVAAQYSALQHAKCLTLFVMCGIVKVLTLQHHSSRNCFAATYMLQMTIVAASNPLLLQGIGAPACAMLLTRWFAARERGTYWGLWVSLCC